MNLAKGLHPRLDESLYQEAGFQPADCVWRRDGYLDLAMLAKREDEKCHESARDGLSPSTQLGRGAA